MSKPEPDPATDDLALVYTNWVRAVPGPFDLAVDFGYQPGDLGPQPMVRVVMTWEHAKILRRALDLIVDRREANTGEIKDPPGVVFGPQEEEKA
jgi:Protein of unknown function (DUF3467)